MKKIKLLLSKNSKKKGGEIVFMLKRVLTILLVIVTIGLITELGYSVTTDSFEVYVTPKFYYSVVIDTRGAAMDFGPMTPNEVRWSSSPTPIQGYPSSATVLNNGNVTADLQIMAEKQSNTVWDATGTTKDTVGFNQCAIAVILTSATAKITAINDDSFPSGATLDTITPNAWRNLDTSMMATGGVDKQANGNDVPMNGLRGIYVRMKAASDTSTTEQQKFRINIRAVTSNTILP